MAGEAEAGHGPDDLAAGEVAAVLSGNDLTHLLDRVAAAADGHGLTRDDLGLIGRGGSVGEGEDARGPATLTEGAGLSAGRGERSVEDVPWTEPARVGGAVAENGEPGSGDQARALLVPVAVPVAVCVCVCVCV